MNTELKRQALERGKIIQNKIEDFCFETIILITRTYEVPTYSFSYTTYEEINKVGTKKIYNIEVIIDGETRAERWGTDIDEMNNQYKILKANCEG